METKNMIYLVSEYANQGEIFGKYFIDKYHKIFLLLLLKITHSNTVLTLTL